MQKTDKPTAGAIKAAKVIILQRWNPWDETACPRLGEIIDREAVLPLVEALEGVTGLIRTVANAYQNTSAEWITQQESFKKAEAIVRKVRQGE